MLKWVGRPLNRVDAVEKVTGRARYIADLNVPGMLHAKLLRSPYAHARIVDIDVSEALKVPGVKAVVSGKDTRDYYIGLDIRDRNPFPVDKVRYYGEAVAGVVALTPEAALEAVEKIKVKYEVLKPVLRPEDALKEDAPIIHENPERYPSKENFKPIKGTNIFRHLKVRRGDVEKAFSEAYKVVEREYRMPHIQHLQLEAHGTIALYGEDGSLTVWTSAQSPFAIRDFLATTFEIPRNKIRVLTGYIGGGFGGKSDITIEPQAVALAMAVPGFPVRLIMDREEVFMGTLIRDMLYAKVKTGVDKDGKIIAQEITYVLAGGAYAECELFVLEGCLESSVGAYEVPNVKVDIYGVYTNTPPCGAFRGYGHTEAHWAIERQMDIVAREIGMDPAEFRRKNMLLPGKINVLGQRIKPSNGRIDLCLEKVLEAINWGKKEEAPRGKRVGKGIALLQKAPVMPPNASSCAIVKFNEDGTVNTIIGSQELGQGIQTAMTQIAAEALRIPPDRVKVSCHGDTDYSPYEWQTVASRGVWSVGNAVLRACKDALSQAMKTASAVLGVRVDELDYSDGYIFVKSQPERRISFAELALGYRYPSGKSVGEPVIGKGSFLVHDLEFINPETGQSNAGAEWTFGAQGAVVEVDELTGYVKVRKLVTAIDPGKVINPVTAKGQVIGGMIMAMGAALMEKIVISEEGKFRNPNLTDYKAPSIRDIPDELEVFFIETPEENGPFGGRSLGEHPILGIAPAIANAVYDAIGVDFYEIPITPSMIVEALFKKRGGKVA